MLKYLFLLTVLFSVACGSTGGTQPGPVVPPVVDVEPETHEKPISFNEFGLKRGGIKQLGEKSLWVSADWNMLPSPRPPENTQRCQAGVIEGNACVKGTKACRTDDKYFTCNTATSRKVFAWVYEKMGPTEFKPFEGVNVEFFNFVECGFLAGDKCKKGYVTTDKWGYFEYVEQGAYFDTLSTKSPEGYFGYCSLGKPVFVNGSHLSYGLPAGEKAFGVFTHQKIKEDSCK